MLSSKTGVVIVRLVVSAVRLACVGGGRGLAGGTCPTLRVAKWGDGRVVVRFGVAGGSSSGIANAQCLLLCVQV
jgi:hypothetical protein